MPISPESFPMPPDDRLGSDDDEGAAPSGPDSAKPYPEKPVQQAQPWSRALALEGRKLLAQGQVLEDQIISRLKNGSEGM